ncbi:MAG: hypothetical protein K0S61_105 [Anaerocolumna sp.]|jgi:hypothetical protein|nr:hypothetical protein [Anaerocolumna sp.]
MKYIVIYLVIGIINSGIGIWNQRKEFEKEFIGWYVLSIVLGTIVWPVTNIWAFIYLINERNKEA